MHLVLNTFGTYLQKENGLFAVVSPEGKQVIYPDKIRTISISGGTRISSDAALLAVDNEIDVIFTDRMGKPMGRLWSVKYGSISNIRRRQIDFAASQSAVHWIKDIIVRKIDNQAALLISLEDNNKHQKAVEKCINRLNTYKEKIREQNAQLINDIAPSLRGWEGAAAKVYFETLSGMLPESVRFEQRSKHPAKDIFNMLLNYGYGMLYGKIEGALIKSGIDPYSGVFHRSDYNRPVLAFDIIELFRVWIDYVVFTLAEQEVIDEDCYSIKDGAYWLESQGKRIFIQSVNDYLEEKIKMNGISRSRATHIELYCQNLAQKFLKFNNK
ncbi:MAG: CRISPR-associated endonuclease Cas1 [Bacteroidota bacterium]|nr:CRISPR-associated endonuclease Cas1 [Bacteroidota bacterium]